MELRQLEILRAIVEAGSFTAAGQKLHVSQSAVSRQILLLEEELGDRVFQRVGKRVWLTPAGEMLLTAANRIFRDLQDTLTQIGGTRQEVRGTLRIAGGMTVCLYTFPRLLKRFRALHPRVELKITSGPTVDILAKIRSNQVDLGLLTMPIVEPDLVTVPVLKEEMVVVTSRRHPLSRKGRIQPPDVAQYPLILFERGSNTRRALDEFFLQEKIPIRVAMDTENVEIIKAMVETGIGITIIPYQAVARETRQGRFFCGRIAGRTLHREVAWIYPKSDYIPRAVQEVLALFQQMRPEFQPRPAPTRQGG
ncbi:MAG: LysR family transcriptional regulator [Acidobacteria bacterium]|nr:LysR family transcriptional regulator [Acidobacteriota bacterium]